MSKLSLLITIFVIILLSLEIKTKSSFRLLEESISESSKLDNKILASSSSNSDIVITSSSHSDIESIKSKSENIEKEGIFLVLEKLGEIPSDKSEVEYNKGVSEKSQSQKSDTVANNFDDEDNIAKYAFQIILVFLTIFLVLFVYNLLKCYLKAPKQITSTVNQGYSRELGELNDDSIFEIPQ